MARASAKQNPHHASTDWKFVWTVALSLGAGVVSYTTLANSVVSLQKEISALQNDTKELALTRERTTVLETKFNNFDKTLSQVADDVKYLRTNGLGTTPQAPHRNAPAQRYQ